MQQKLYILLFSIAVFFGFDVCAQFDKHALEQDTGRADTLYYFKFSEKDILNDSFPTEKPIVFDLFQRYLPETNLFPYLFIGNPGHAMYSPVFSLNKPENYAQGVSSGTYPYLFRRENADFYRSKPPYTSLFYMFGAKKEELLDVVHSRNFGRNLNLSLHLLRQGSEGFYNNIKTKSANFDIDFNYATSNRRYTLLASYQYNKKTLNENGGYVDFGTIQNPETFGSSNLSNASNVIRDEGLFIAQSLGVGNRNLDKEKNILPWFRLGYDFQYARSYRTFFDPGDADTLNRDFYKNVYFDPTTSQDSVNHSLFVNQGNLWIYPSKHLIKAHFRQELIDYRQGVYIDTLYENYFAGGQFDLNLSNQSKVVFGLDYGVNGFRKGDVNAEARFTAQKRDSTSSYLLEAAVGHQLSNPLFNELYYVSNNFIWFNDFEKEATYFAELKASKAGYSLDLKAGTTKNKIYYNTEATASQHTESIEFLTVGFHKRLNWKNLHLDNRLQYQYFSNEEILPLPTFMVWESLYYQNFLLKKLLTFQVGFDVFYYSQHYGYAYMPALNQFHLQDQEQIGSYPYIDFYLNFKLKRAFFFFKIEHFSKGMFGTNYFQVPNYPMPKRAFKMGIKWTLFD